MSSRQHLPDLLFANDKENNGINTGILKLSLANTLPTHALSFLLQVVEGAYYQSFLTRQTDTESGVIIPSEQGLYLKRLEIGTPNFVELIGISNNLLPGVDLISTALGIGLIPLAIKSIKSVFDIKKLWAECRKLEAETSRTQAEEERVKAETLKLQAESRRAEAEVALKMAETENTQLEVSEIRDRGLVPESLLKLNQLASEQRELVAMYPELRDRFENTFSTTLLTQSEMRTIYTLMITVPTFVKHIGLTIVINKQS